jgi:hypothetical protein
MKLPILAGLLAATCLAACTPAGDDDDSTPAQSQIVEFADIFIPERVIEIPVVPAGTEVVTEVPIHNAGDQNLTIEDISLNYDSDPNFTLNEDTVPPVIRPHGVAVIEVNYVAAEAADTFAALDILSDDPDEAEKTVAFIGRQATGGPHARVSANTLDWGFQFRGQEVHKLVEVHNDGDEPLQITDIVFNQSIQQVAFHAVCPGQQLADCDWTESVRPDVLSDPILPGSAALLEIAFVPLTLQSTSAELRISTSDPVRPQFSVFLIGNGDSALNCTPPTITVTSPTEAAFFHSWEDLVVSARVFDQEQPAGTLLVEMFIGDVFIENAFPDENGRVTFVIDIDDHEPTLPSGLQPIVLRVTDGCPTYGFTTFVAAIDFPLSSTDLDGDGFDTNQGDCDDGDPTAFPQNTEVFDGVDNDCDGHVDEGTEVWDDDCDGFCEHESICLGQADAVIGGTCDGLASQPFDDCNDSPFDLNQDGEADGTAIHPDADEVQTFIDDNCNGVVDEGTSLFDDDGDGQTEVNFDCNDDDPLIFQGATEWCDGADNDCDGDIDEFCIDQTAPPRIIGGIITDKFQMGFGDRTRAQVLVVSSDPNLTFQWFADMGAAYDEPATGPVVFWNAPADTDENKDMYNGSFPNLWVEVTDSLGQKDTAFGQVLISTNVFTTFSPVRPADQGDGTCSLSARRGGWLLLLPLLGAIRRRRR